MMGNGKGIIRSKERQSITVDDGKTVPGETGAVFACSAIMEVENEEE